MLKGIVLFVFFYWSTTCFSQYSDSTIRSRAYSPNVYWLSDSSYAFRQQKYYSNGRPFVEFNFNANGQLTGQRQFSSKGELLMDAKVSDFDSVQTEFELLYRIFLNAKTYYENANLRSNLVTTRSKMRSTVFNSEGKRLYTNLINQPYSEKADTVQGIFTSNSWYTWIEYKLYANSEVDLIFTIPLEFRKSAVNEPDSADQLCETRYCVTYINPKLSQKKIDKYQKLIETAIENNLITSLANCHLQF